MIISIIIDPVKDTVLKRGNFPVIVEKVGNNWGDFHVIMKMITSNRVDIVTIKTVQYHCFLEQERMIIKKLEQEMKNMPTWMAKRSKTTFLVDKPTKPPAFLFSAVCFNAAPSNHARPMPININNGLPAVAIRFGVSDEKEMSFYVHIDSCTGLNIENLNVHKWGIIIYQYIFKN